MALQIETIPTHFMLGISVNCYLLRAEDGFILIDTAKTGQRAAMESALQQAGVTAQNLKLIVLTHGDFDHCGNAAYLSRKFNAQIALHPSDSGMVERGDMFASRKPPNRLMRWLIGLIFSLPQTDRFTPQVWLREGDNLHAYGLAASVIELPGHCRGNIGLLATSGALFCGDLFGNTSKPKLWSLVDDAVAMQASAEKLRPLAVTTVYPGHGKPFQLYAFWANHSAQ